MLQNFPVIRLIISFILPYIFLYAIYIQLNGEISPGGGFQAGVIFASGLIGYELIASNENFLQITSIKFLTICGILGVVIYASVGAISFIFNENYLNYNILNAKQSSAQQIGIFIIELGVGLSVASVMCLIYILLKED